VVAAEADGSHCVVRRVHCSQGRARGQVPDANGGIVPATGKEPEGTCDVIYDITQHVAGVRAGN
jgi:hypothetical protein